MSKSIVCSNFIIIKYHDRVGETSLNDYNKTQGDK